MEPDPPKRTGGHLWRALIGALAVAASALAATAVTRVKDIRPGAADSAPLYLTDVAGTLFFSANDGTHGYELWKSDGTAAETSLHRLGAEGHRLMREG